MAHKSHRQAEGAAPHMMLKNRKTQLRDGTRDRRDAAAEELGPSPINVSFQMAKEVGDKLPRLKTPHW